MVIKRKLTMMMMMRKMTKSPTGLSLQSAVGLTAVVRFGSTPGRDT